MFEPGTLQQIRGEITDAVRKADVKSLEDDDAYAKAFSQVFSYEEHDFHTQINLYLKAAKQSQGGVVIAVNPGQPERAIDCHSLDKAASNSRRTVRSSFPKLCFAFWQVMNLWTSHKGIREFCFGKKISRLASQLMKVRLLCYTCELPTSKRIQSTAPLHAALQPICEASMK